MLEVLDDDGGVRLKRCSKRLVRSWISLRVLRVTVVGGVVENVDALLEEITTNVAVRVVKLLKSINELRS